MTQHTHDLTRKSAFVSSGLLGCLGSQRCFVEYALYCGFCFFLFCFMCISPLMKYNWDVSRSNKQRHGEPFQPRVLLLPHFYFYPSPFSTFPLTFWLSPHNKGLGSPHIKMGQSSRISVISNFRWRRKGRLVSWQVRQLHLYLSACLHIKKQTYGEIII